MAQPLADPSSCSSLDLPQSLLCLILELACADGGAVPTAAAAACVSRAWRSAALEAEPRLWRSADLSFGWCRATNGALARLASRGALAQTHTLSLGGCAALSDPSLASLATGCPSLTALDLSSTAGFTGAALSQLARSLPSLRRLSLAGALTRPAGGHGKALATALPFLAASLSVLTLARSQALSQPVMAALCTLSVLTVLDLTAACGRGPPLSLPVEALQRGTPRLAALRLAGLGLDVGWVASPPPPQQQAAAQASAGWPDLVEASLGGTTRLSAAGVTAASVSCVDDALLLRLLGRSPLLEVLSVAGSRATAAGLAALPATNLVRLHAERCPAACDAGAAAAAARWAASLASLSLAGAGPRLGDAGLAAIAAGAGRGRGCAALRSLDVGGCNATRRGVEALLAGCPALEALGLDGCRALRRPLRQAAGRGVGRLRAALREQPAGSDDEGGG